MNKLEIKNLHAKIGNKEILKGINLTIKLGEIHAIMGPNGAGKSCLANVLMGNPKYEITKGKILLNKKNITNLSTDKRARLGLFLSFQYPEEINGLTLSSFLRTTYNSINKKQMGVLEFHKFLLKKMKKINMNPSFIKRYLNLGFSGGEKKRSEILQMAILNPKYSILDETDSGLDVNALKIIGENIMKMHSKDKSIMIITHYSRIFRYVLPDKVSLLIDGRIIKTGDKKLAREIEKNGFNKYLKK